MNEVITPNYTESSYAGDMFTNWCTNNFGCAVSLDLNGFSKLFRRYKDN